MRNVFEVFAIRIRERREAARLSATDAADSLGVSRGYVGNLELGRNTPNILALLRHLCEMYGTSADYLLGLSDNPEAKEKAATGAGQLFQIFDKLNDERRVQLVAIAEGMYLSQLRDDAIAGDDDAVIELIKQLDIEQPLLLFEN